MSRITQGETGELIRATDGGDELRVIEGLYNGLLTIARPGDEGPRQTWSFPTVTDAIQAFVVWEPGTVAICAVCTAERGGDDPPGPWIREQPSNRRRIPIYGEYVGVIGGWFNYVYR